MLCNLQFSNALHKHDDSECWLYAHKLRVAQLAAAWLIVKIVRDIRYNVESRCRTAMCHVHMGEIRIAARPIPWGQLTVELSHKIAINC